MDQDNINQRIDHAQNTTDKNGALDEFLYKKVREEIGGLSESKTKLHRTIWKFLSKTADHWNPDNSIRGLSERDIYKRLIELSNEVKQEPNQAHVTPPPSRPASIVDPYTANSVCEATDQKSMLLLFLSSLDSTESSESESVTEALALLGLFVILVVLLYAVYLQLEPLYKRFKRFILNRI